MKLSVATEKFKFKGFNYGVKSQVIGKSLMNIYQKYDGKLTPEAVVKEAKIPKHPLHPCFEWDNKKAAHQHRLFQARKMISCVVVERNTNDGVKEIRAFVNIQTDENNKLSTNPFNYGKGESFFVATSDALNDDVLRQYTLDIALRDLGYWVEKYKSIKELAAFFEYSKKTIAKLKKTK